MGDKIGNVCGAFLKNVQSFVGVNLIGLQLTLLAGY